jgi:hypothetical protein
VYSSLCGSSTFQPEHNDHERVPYEYVVVQSRETRYISDRRDAEWGGEPEIISSFHRYIPSSYSRRVAWTDGWCLEPSWGISSHSSATYKPFSGFYHRSSSDFFLSQSRSMVSWPTFFSRSPM